MPRILIPTLPEDVHATVVAAALESLGVEAVLWYGAQFPAAQTQSVSIGDGHDFSWAVETADDSFGGDGFDVVWARRIQPPEAPDHVHPDDAAFLARALRRYHSALWNAIEPHAFWVNPFAAQGPSNSKIQQLRIAQAASMTIPPTLVSNDPDAIREFLARHRRCGTIYKGFYPASWEEDGQMFNLPTRRVTRDDLPEDDMLRAVPGIFQVFIEKAFEVRLTMFGSHPVAVRIDSQAHPDGEDDWRVISIGEMRIVPHEMPASILAQIREFMRRLGIVFGCFDFIVRPEGGYVFLEVNQSGQWLWVEQAVPELPMLETFCRFLLHGSPDYDGSIGAQPLRFEDVVRGCRERLPF